MRGRSGPATSSYVGSVTEMDVVLVGFGTVGQGVAESIAKKNDLLQNALGEKVRIVGAFDSSSYALDKSGLDPLELVKTKMTKRHLGKGPPRRSRTSSRA